MYMYARGMRKTHQWTGFSCLELGAIYVSDLGRSRSTYNYNDHQDTFVWQKSHPYGVTVKIEGAPGAPTPK